MDGAVPHYFGSHIEQQLAEDARTSELGIQVTVLGDRVLLRGEVAGAERRARVDEVVRALIDGFGGKLTVVDEITVTSAPEPAEDEREVLP